MKNAIIRHNEKKKIVFLLTGAGRKTGVSTVAFNLALMCGWDMPERRILLIDANMNFPSLHKSFSINITPGLTDFLLYEDTSISEIFYKSKFNNLELIPLGKSCENLPSPFTKKKFSDLILSIKEEYDIVFIDSEPSISSGYTQNILSHVDGVVVIAESGKTRFNDINEINIQMLRSGTCVIGSFLNRREKIIPYFIDKYL
ncbi:CpsD/CapB family tyrosine-protein kinase [Desulfobulbus sp. F3]|nr:CpsD/CapB family tyrosine-protein kinase [Desulfobulbus sp. F3]